MNHPLLAFLAADALVNGGRQGLRLPYNLTEDEVCDAAAAGSNIGFCVRCGHRQADVEPDAYQVTCDHCSNDSVYGADEVLLRMG